MECWKCKYYQDTIYGNKCSLLNRKHFFTYYRDWLCPVVEDNGSVNIDKYEEWLIENGNEI